MINEGLTYLNALGMSFMALMGLLTLIVPRKYAAIPILITACYVTMGQRVVVFTLDFTMMRILVFFGWVRVFIRGEAVSFRLNAIDKAVIWWTVVSVITYMLLRQSGEAFVNRLGFAFNVVGIYFLFRVLIRDLEEAVVVIKALSIVAVPLALSMVIEQLTMRNLFSVFGGVTEITGIREGRLRAQGSFSHPILAGTFGATLMPLFAALWYRGNRALAAAGFAAASVITFASSSSGPGFAYIAGLVALWMWALRHRMQAVRWAIAFTLISLHIVMKAPVWFLIARARLFSGSTGYHRANLIDKAVRHFWDWWLVGTESTSAWGWHLFDITNQYIYIGVEGGVFSLALFITVLVFCFKGIGKAVNSPGLMAFEDRKTIWALGAALVVHMVSFISVSYFDQSVLYWYLLLAVISASTGVFLLPGPSKALSPGIKDGMAKGSLS